MATTTTRARAPDQKEGFATPACADDCKATATVFRLASRVPPLAEKARYLMFAEPAGPAA
jgi:hypothetical protein